MIVYKITNLITNKVYIGQTVQSIKQRWQEHCKPSNKSCRALKAAINKHGKDTFEIEVLECCESIDQLNSREIYWIKFYNSISPNGYNLEFGGGSKGKASIETIEKMKRNYIDNPELTKLISNSSKQNWASKEYRAKISKARKNTWKDSQYKSKMSIIRKSLHKDQDIHKKIIAGLLKSNIKKRKIVTAFYPNGEPYVTFFSIKDATTFGFTQSEISTCCKYEHRTHKGYHWRFTNGQ